jgi:hypothetical protein
MLEFGVALINGIIDGFPVWMDWITEHVINPIITAVTGVDLNPILQAFTRIGTGIIDGITDALTGMGEAVWNFIVRELQSVGDRELLGIPGLSVNNIGERWEDLGLPTFAKGGLLEGLGIVGEKGPELAFAGRPTAILSHDRSVAALSDAMGGGGGAYYNFAGSVFNLPGVTNPRQFLQQLEREAGRDNRKLTTRRK